MTHSLQQGLWAGSVVTGRCWIYAGVLVVKRVGVQAAKDTVQYSMDTILLSILRPVGFAFVLQYSTALSLSPSPAVEWRQQMIQ